MALKIGRLFQTWLNYLDGIFFHERCRVCTKLLPPSVLAAEHYSVRTEEIPKAICFECWRQALASNPTIELCPLKNAPSLKIASGRLYTGHIKRLIYKLKYDNDRLLAYDLALLVEKAWRLIAHNYVDEPVVLIPIPLHSERLWQRGYNQAEEIAKHLSTRVEAPVETRALKRVKNTEAQFGLSRLARLQNMNDAFVAGGKFCVGRHVILIDDVYTSGATLVEAAQEILDSGALSVLALTVARAVFKEKTACGKSLPSLPHKIVSVDKSYQNDNIQREVLL
ncbi:MAG: ComF family protein [Candidatus Obscuribacterales bacterium]|nr:ComF family protein [Candidatus Obscuribacterales bacterium]